MMLVVDFESWVVGFIEGEGCPTYQHSGSSPEFTLVQNEREILERVRDYLGMGRITPTSNKKAWQLRVSNKPGCRKLRAWMLPRLQSETKRRQWTSWKV